MKERTEVSSGLYLRETLLPHITVFIGCNTEGLTWDFNFWNKPCRTVVYVFSCVFPPVCVPSWQGPCLLRSGCTLSMPTAVAQGSRACLLLDDWLSVFCLLMYLLGFSLFRVLYWTLSTCLPDLDFFSGAPNLSHGRGSFSRPSDLPLKLALGYSSGPRKPCAHWLTCLFVTWPLQYAAGQPWKLRYCSSCSR